MVEVGGQLVIDLPSARSRTISLPGAVAIAVPNSVVPVTPVGLVAVFSGSGVLTASFIIIAQATAGFSGTGVLTADASAHALIDAALSGSGALSAAVQVPVAAAFTGAGFLTAGDTANTSLDALFTSTGTLGAQTMEGATRAAVFSGSGSLSAGATAKASVAADFTGAGQLGATISVAGGFIVAADFTGSGTLSAVAVPAFKVGADFSSTGSLAAQALAAFLRAAGFTGAGTLSATSYAAIPVGAPLTGSGGLSAGVKVGVLAPFSGAGSFAAVASVPFTNMRMNKSGTFTSPGQSTAYFKVTGWTADGAYPGTVITSDALVIAQAGTGKTISGACSYNNAFFGNTNAQLYKNGVAFGSPQTLTGGSNTFTWSYTGQTVAPGDTWDMRVADPASWINSPSVNAAGTFLKVE